MSTFMKGLQYNAGLLLNSGEILVNLEAGTYCINDDTEFKVVFNSNYNEMIIPNGATLYKIHRDFPKIIRYDRNNDAPPIPDELGGYIASSLSPSEYKDINNKYYDHSNGENIYPDIDTELKHRRMLHELYNHYTAIKSEPRKTYDEVKIDVIGTFEQTGSEFIETPYRIGTTQWNTGDPKSIYKVLSAKVAVDEAKKYIAQYPKRLTASFMTSLDKIEFLRLDGNYVFSSFKNVYRWIEDIKAVEIFETLKEAKAHEQFIRDFVGARINGALNPVMPDEKSKEDIVQEINRIKALRAKSHAAYVNGVIRSLDKILEGLNKNRG